MVKKIIALMLVLGVLGGMIGCSSGDTGPATTADKGGAAAPTTG